jgi:hypothetical protein
VTLAQRLLALHRAFDAAGLPHAFGGAIALAFWTLEPRTTRDLDVNVFVPAADAPRVLAALPAGVDRPDGAAEQLARDGQKRLWWEDTPVDLFLDYAPIHRDAAEHARRVPFEGVDIPVLGPVELAVFKAMFDRTKDWADIEALLEAGTVRRLEIEQALAAMVGADDPRVARLGEAAARAGAAHRDRVTRGS